MSKSSVPIKRRSKNNASPNHSKSGRRQKSSLRKLSQTSQFGLTSNGQFREGQRYQFKKMIGVYMGQKDGSIRRIG